MVCSSVTSALDYLIKGQHSDGSWTDFWLPVGTSDAWATAFVGLAVFEASRSGVLSGEMRLNLVRSARSAGRFLLESVREGWGYNGSVPPDADSTAHAVSLLSRLGLSVPESAFELLERHHVPGSGYRTYRFQHPSHKWTQPSPDVTAAVLRALFDAGRLNRKELAKLWPDYLFRHRTKKGTWKGYWWIRHAYPTMLSLEVWELAKNPAPEFREKIPLGTRSNPFDTAWMIRSYLILDRKEDALRLCRRLLCIQSRDGGWPSDPILMVPPHHGVKGEPSPLYLGRDSKRFFATSAAVHALISALGKYPDLQEPREGKQNRPGTHFPISKSGGGIFDLIRGSAESAGFNVDTAKQIQDLLRLLTRGSLAPGNPWPSSQLSALAAGVPVEFSCRLTSKDLPALRYTVEVGNPFLPPHSRACSAVHDIRYAAEFLGYEASWDRVKSGIERLISPDIKVSNDTRFWVWSGVDHKIDAFPNLKIYLNLFGDKEEKSRARLESALGSASIPITRNLSAGLDRLDRAGFLQEAGFGFGPNGKIAFKVYYELRGWKPELVQTLLEFFDLPRDLSLLRPEIPGILKESLAKKNRSGIAIRINPDSGAVSELTVSAAFLPAMLPAEEMLARLVKWIRSQGWDPGPFSRLADSLPGGSETRPVKRFSLFTRTVGQNSSWATIYIRPKYDAVGWNGKPIRQTLDKIMF